MNLPSYFLRTHFPLSSCDCSSCTKQNTCQLGMIISRRVRSLNSCPYSAGNRVPAIGFSLNGKNGPVFWIISSWLFLHVGDGKVRRSQNEMQTLACLRYVRNLITSKEGVPGCSLHLWQRPMAWLSKTIGYRMLGMKMARDTITAMSVKSAGSLCMSGFVRYHREKESTYVRYCRMD